jgi:hypothetical protein
VIYRVSCYNVSSIKQLEKLPHGWNNTSVDFTVGIVRANSPDNKETVLIAR